MFKVLKSLLANSNQMKAIDDSESGEPHVDEKKVRQENYRCGYSNTKR